MPSALIVSAIATGHPVFGSNPSFRTWLYSIFRRPPGFFAVPLGRYGAFSPFSRSRYVRSLALSPHSFEQNRIRRRPRSSVRSNFSPHSAQLRKRWRRGAPQFLVRQRCSYATFEHALEQYLRGLPTLPVLGGKGSPHTGHSPGSLPSFILARIGQLRREFCCWSTISASSAF